MISPQTVTPSFGTSNIIYIRGGLDGAKNYPVTPGYTAWMIDEENKKFFIKSIGANGVPNIREFDYEEKNSQMQASSSDNSSKYATKEDFEYLKREIRKLHEKRNTYKPNNNYRRSGNGGKSYGKPV